MNAAPLLPLGILGVAGYIISIILLPQVFSVKDDVSNAGICVQASPTVVIQTPTIDHNGNPYCKRGQLVKVVPPKS